MNELRVYGEKAYLIKKEGKFMLVEAETAFYILAYDVEKEKWVPVQGLSKMMYDVEDAIQEFEDFVRC